MNIKQYAINSKLKRNSELLDYVLKNEPIPIEVLDAEFSDVIIEDSIADLDLLETDYKSYLQKTIKVGIVPLKSEQLEVSGEIPDELIETITQLHGVNREEIVESLVTDVITSINENKKAIIRKVEYTNSEKVSLPIKQVEVIEKDQELSHEEVQLMDTMNTLDDVLFTDKDANVYHVEDNKLVEYNIEPDPLTEYDELIDSSELDISPLNEYVESPEMDHAMSELEANVQPIEGSQKTDADIYQMLVDIIKKHKLTDDLTLDIKEIHEEGVPLNLG